MGEAARSRRLLRTTVRLAALIVFALGSHGVAQSSGESAQSGCLHGKVTMAMNVSGRIEVCPDYAAKVPDLQKRLDALQKNLSGNQELLRELTRSARGVNALGRNVDENRQVELLQSFSRELQSLNAVDQKQRLQQTAQLADKLDNLQDLITQSKEDEKTAVQTMTALNGKLGDAIAALDLTKAQQQLDQIQAKLNKIDANTERTNQILEEQAAREKEKDEQQKKEAQALDADPNMYTRAQIMPLASFDKKQRPYMIFFYSRPPLYPPFIDSTLSIAFHKGSEAWRLDATDKQVSAGGELWHVDFDEVGDRATICFVAHDKQSGRLKEWMQRYKVTPATSGPGGVNFIPDGDAVMRLTNGGPCDGVTNVRKVQTAATESNGLGGSTELDAQNAKIKEMQAQQQAQIAELQERAMKARSSPATFANLRAEGSRRDGMNNYQWLIKVSAQPFRPGTTLYDVQLQGNLLDASGRLTPLTFSNRQLFVNIESRYAWVDRMGTKAVVCLTAKDATHEKPVRLTQWFSIETGRVYWKDGGAQHPGDQATFVPSQPATLGEASNSPCQ